MKLPIYLNTRRFLPSVFCVLFIAVFVSAQNFRTIQDGIEYAEMSRGTEKEPVHINLLRLDLTKVRLDVVKALDAAVGLETTSSMATRYGAIAAINAGFFRLDKSIFAGDAAGVLQIDGKLLSEANGRIAMLISNTTSACTSCPTEKRTVVSFEHLNSNGSFVVGQQKLEILGINRERKAEDVVLFTPEFGKTPPADAKVLEIIVRKKKIKEILQSNGGTPIRKNSFVLSISGNESKKSLLQTKTGKKALVIINTYINKTPTSENQTKFEFRNAEDITNGVPQLIKNGKIEITWQQEKSSKSFVETRHPRTAAAKLKDGKFLLITVDGRQPETSVGMNLQELAEFLLELGATDAMNLDGGGSTTMFVGGKVVNRPSDKEGERKVGDAILVFLRKRR